MGRGVVRRSGVRVIGAGGAVAWMRILTHGTPLGGVV